MKIVFFTGAGISAESGIKTFRDHDGLWEGHDPMIMAHIKTWNENKILEETRKTMLRFYNERRRQLKTVQPNLAHEIIAELESEHEITVITQNVDNLHERAGSSNVVHLHGSLTQAKSNKTDAFDIDYNDINFGDKCPHGKQLRPAVVWFGEGLPNLYKAADIIDDCDMIVSIGTSAQVEPAASLFFNNGAEKVIINPKFDSDIHLETMGIKLIESKATDGMVELKEYLKNK